MRLKENKGITLIALVVTIIVLIILAGVSINLVLGENGLITKAKGASELTKRTQYIEDLQMAIVETELEFYGENKDVQIGKVTSREGERTTFIEKLKTNIEKLQWVTRVEEGTNELLVISEDDYQILVNANNETKRANVVEESFEEVKGECTVTFNGNGAAESNITQRRTAGFSMTLPENTFTAPTNYSFVGWNTREDGTGDTIQPGQKLRITEDITLYAKWSRNAVTIKYEKNAEDATGTMSDTTVDQGSSTNLRENTFERQYYNFTGWNTEIDGSGTSYTDKELITANSSMTLYAKWERITYSVTYNSNAGEDTVTNMPSNQTKLAGETLSLSSAEPTRSGYQFLGWATTSSGEVVYQPEDDYTTDAQITLHAIWRSSKVYLYLNSNQCSDITGGWRTNIVGSGNSASVNTNISCSCGTGNGGGNAAKAITNNTFDMSKYSQLCFNVTSVGGSYYGTRYVCIGYGEDNYTDTDIKFNDVVVGVNRIPLTNVTDNLVVKVVTGSGSYITVDQVWLER